MACDLGLGRPSVLHGVSCCGVHGAVTSSKTLHLHMHLLDPGVNGYLVGQ